MTIKWINAIIANKLVFDPSVHPPSQEDIDRRLAQLSDKLICNVGLLASLAGALNVIASICAFVGIGGTLLSWLITALPFNQLALYVLGGGLVGAGLMFLASEMEEQLFDAQAALTNEKESLQPIPQSECAKVLSLCAGTPEGERYRQQIIQSARHFVEAEHEMLNAWNNAAHERVAEAALYKKNEE
ncbi:UDP-N-acetylmuramoylalanine--D-glutamate ligase [Novimethylophilus kurashikiensis]|uniref:UDP-N-acetylmuramoylalanine--D-glutamate ligase n=1 Tax=Novimethylophilus kurashikiensis TaxID=1825523 RepID=A0A2R5F8P2_9PROT|nr:hypothetical protein [Novimethylophilus kurashikiensis]GBG14567.1 UDP-N-acetylmuramoylalanine--D-glutamate ligase [Novimethylophilus kurashikiensis]